MSVDQHGVVSTGTRQNLISGLRSDAMSPQAVDAVMKQMVEFAEQLVETYSSQVAAGEVGTNGSGRATEEPILGSLPPRELLYGRVQSGKTVAMILTAALALDNGFRIVVVLTSDNVALVNQTASRFKNLDGPRVFSGARDGESYEWQGQEEQLRASITADGLVLVCAKNADNLPQVLRFLWEIGAAGYPVLVMDDEADAATPDTTVAARSAQKRNAPSQASTINRLVVENDDPDEVGFSLGEMLPHSLNVQVTATPYVLLLQRVGAPIRPTKASVLEPGEGYCGGEIFFGDYDVISAANVQPKTIVVVGDNEAALMARRVPAGLGRSIDFFVLSACARAVADSWPKQGFKHLSHTSARTDEHDLVANQISSHINDLRDRTRGDQAGLLAYFAGAYSELQRSLDSCPPLAQLVETASAALRQAEVVRINSKVDKPVYGPRLNFVVGGNILGRGLTIDDLLVTYYIREAKTPQMDTVWQHARMFGYRQGYLDYIRVFLPHRLAVLFKELHEAEDALRQSMIEGRDVRAVLIRQPANSRATRPNALEARVVRSIRAGRDQIFPHYFEVDQEGAAATLHLLEANDVPIQEGERATRPTLVPSQIARQLIDGLTMRDNDPGLFEGEIVKSMLDSYAGFHGNGCLVYVRHLTTEPPSGGWIRGRLSGEEIDFVRTAAGDVPALALLYHGPSNAPDAWYPTLVMPVGTPAWVFSFT